MNWFNCCLSAHLDLILNFEWIFTHSFNMILTPYLRELRKSLLLLTFIFFLKKLNQFGAHLTCLMDFSQLPKHMDKCKSVSNFIVIFLVNKRIFFYFFNIILTILNLFISNLWNSIHISKFIYVGFSKFSSYLWQRTLSLERIINWSQFWMVQYWPKS